MGEYYNTQLLNLGSIEIDSEAEGCMQEFYCEVTSRER